MSSLGRHALASLIGAGGGFFMSRYTFPVEQNVIEELPVASSISKPLLTPRALKILAFGQPTATVPSPMVYSNHVLEYDCTRKVPKWVAEHLTKDQVKQDVVNRKGVKFTSDPVVPVKFASSNKDYWSKRLAK